MVSLDVVFPLAVTGQIAVNLRFAFKTKTHIGRVAIGRFVIAEQVLGVNTAVQVEFITIFVVDFGRIGH
ncbi:hypothetical protein D3C78_1989670 [compost metagenome]